MLRRMRAETVRAGSGMIEVVGGVLVSLATLVRFYS
jgi:hypothetical protein